MVLFGENTNQPRGTCCACSEIAKCMKCKFHHYNPSFLQLLLILQYLRVQHGIVVVVSIALQSQCGVDVVWCSCGVVAVWCRVVHGRCNRALPVQTVLVQLSK